MKAISHLVLPSVPGNTASVCCVANNDTHNNTVPAVHYHVSLSSLATRQCRRIKIRYQYVLIKLLIIAARTSNLLSASCLSECWRHTYNDHRRPCPPLVILVLEFIELCILNTPEYIDANILITSTARFRILISILMLQEDLPPLHRVQIYRHCCVGGGGLSLYCRRASTC